MEGACIGEDCNIGGHAFIEGGAVVGDRVTVKNGALIWNGSAAYVSVAGYGYGLNFFANGGNVETYAGYANAGLNSSGYVKSRILNGVAWYDSGGGLSGPYVLGDHDMDYIDEGSNYKRTTTNQRDGGGRAYGSINSSNQITGDLYGSYSGNRAVSVGQLIEARFLAYYLGDERSFDADYRVTDDKVDALSVKADSLTAHNTVATWRSYNSFPDAGDGFNRFEKA